MNEIARLLSINCIHSTPYHPQANGLVERMNGTLKTMLRRMCAENPLDWDRYVESLLFAYRETAAQLTILPLRVIVWTKGAWANDNSAGIMVQ